MQIMAVQKYTRQTPRKVRLVANTVKKLPLDQAFRQLSVMERRASLVVTKVLKQAVANAMNNHGYRFSDLSIEKMIVNEGPRYRRFRAVSRGRAHGVIKRSSHITVVLKTSEPTAPAKAAAEVKAAEKKTETTGVVKAEKKTTKKVRVQKK